MKKTKNSKKIVLKISMSMTVTPSCPPPLPSIQMTGTQPLSPLTDTDQVMGNVQDAAGQHPPTQTPGEVSSPPGHLTIRIPGPTT